MTTPRTPRTPREKVPDSELLDEDDDFNLAATEEDYRILKETPRSGKRIRMNSPPPRSPASSSDSPPETPPRRISSPERIQALASSTPTLKHVCRTNIYIYTDERSQLQKITDAEFTTHPDFYKRKSSLENLVTRARMIIMQQEPFHTLLQLGYDFNLTDDQLSYKVFASDDNEIIDFVLDQKVFNYAGALRIPRPYYEETESRRASQVDIAFRFTMETQQLPKKPTMVSTGTTTFDAEVITPIIDQIRFTAVKLSGILNRPENSGQLAANNSRPIIPIMPDEVAQPPIRHRQDRSTSSSRHRAQDRLGPPIPRQFAPRQRGHQGPRHRGHRGFQGAKRARHFQQ